METINPTPSFIAFADRVRQLGPQLPKFNFVQKRSNFDKLKQRAVFLGDLGDENTVCIRVEGRNEARVKAVSELIWILWNHSPALVAALEDGGQLLAYDDTTTIEELYAMIDQVRDANQAVIDALDGAKPTKLPAPALPGEPARSMARAR